MFIPRNVLEIGSPLVQIPQEPLVLGKILWGPHLVLEFQLLQVARVVPKKAPGKKTYHMNGGQMMPEAQYLASGTKNLSKMLENVAALTSPVDVDKNNKENGLWPQCYAPNHRSPQRRSYFEQCTPADTTQP